jgi:hypothetical protein
MGSEESVLTAMTDETSIDTPTIVDSNFRRRFSDILGRWSEGCMDKDDYAYFKAISISSQEYIVITNEFNLRHGVEPIDNQIILLECPTAVHEYLS